MYTLAPPHKRFEPPYWKTLHLHVTNILFHAKIETKVDKTYFDVKVINKDNRDEKDVEVFSYSSREVKPTVALDYQLACDRVSNDIALPQRYDYVILICYTLNVDEWLQKS